MAMPELTEDSQQSKRPHQEEKIFDFFGLPRELRDVIYDCLSVDVKPKLESSLEKTVNPVPEYEDRIVRHTKLVLVDNEDHHHDAAAYAKLSTIRSVQLRLVISDRSDARREIERHREWATRALAVPQLTRCDVHIYIEVGEAYGSSEWTEIWEGRDFRKQLNEFVAKLTPDTLAIYTSDGPVGLSLCAAEDEEVTEGPRVIWTKESGSVEHS